MEFRTNTSWKNNIFSYENKDRKITEQTLPYFFNKGTIITSITETELLCNVDLEVDCTYNNRNFRGDIEIKTFKNPCTYTPKIRSIEDSAMLKVEKLNNMKKHNVENNKDFLLYVVLINKKAYYFDCDKLDWDNIYREEVNQKQTQMNPNSIWIKKDTYFIPLSKAYKVIDYGNN